MGSSPNVIGDAKGETPRQTWGANLMRATSAAGGLHVVFPAAFFSHSTLLLSHSPVTLCLRSLTKKDEIAACTHSDASIVDNAIQLLRKRHPNLFAPGV